MGEFFRGWRRKAGVFTLVMALVVTACWLRRIVMRDARTKVAVTMLRMADEAIKEGKAPAAREILNMVIVKFGDTTSAQVAKERLEQLNHQP